MTYVRGLDCSLIRNTGGAWGTPSWSDVDIVESAKLSLGKDTTESKTRKNRRDGVKRYIAIVKDWSVDVQMQFSTTDTHFVAIRDAYLNDTTVDIVALIGANADSGSEGPRAEWLVTDLAVDEPLDSEATVSFKLVPAESTNAPIWYTVP